MRNTTLSGNDGNSPDAGAGGLLNVGIASLNNVTIRRTKEEGTIKTAFEVADSSLTRVLPLSSKTVSSPTMMAAAVPTTAPGHLPVIAPIT